MDNKETIESITRRVEGASTNFEKTNTDLKRRFLLWNIESFNIIASKVTGNKGTFGTGYPFYALDENMEGTLPIIGEQIRYNRQLVKDGVPVQKSIWQCKYCLEEKYSTMPDLKKICKPCPNMLDSLKPRKIINRLPDMDLWVVCEDGGIEKAQEEMTKLLNSIRMCSSDINPITSIEYVERIADMLKEGKMPNTFLPIDAHIIEYSAIKRLIEQVPAELRTAKERGKVPYLPIHPKSYRKNWQYDDEAYNYIYDYLSAFTPFNFSEDLQQTLEESRKKVISDNTPEQLFGFLLASATKANFRRFQSIELENCFINKVIGWEKLRKKDAHSINCNNRCAKNGSDIEEPGER